MSYWSLDKKSCLQYCRHFLADNGVFHGELQSYSALSALVFPAAAAPTFCIHPGAAAPCGGSGLRDPRECGGARRGCGGARGRSGTAAPRYRDRPIPPVPGLIDPPGPTRTPSGTTDPSSSVPPAPLGAAGAGPAGFGPSPGCPQSPLRLDPTDPPLVLPVLDPLRSD